MTTLSSTNPLIAVEITGLFGTVNHSIEVRPDAPTIITGPNGTGKTHLFKLVQAVMKLDVAVLFAVEFATVSLEFNNGWMILVDRLVDEVNDPEPILNIRASLGGVVQGAGITKSRDALESSSPEFPDNFRRLADGRWHDRRTGRLYSDRFVQQNYAKKWHWLSDNDRAANEKLIEMCSGPGVVLIDTGRLDVSKSADEDSRAGINSTSAESRIVDYTNRLRQDVSEARRGSIRATQSADLSFAARAIEAANLEVAEEELHERYDAILERYENLARNALAVGERPLEFPSETSITVRRILHVFLDDWDKRLEPLMPLNEKITTLRDILDSKLEKSGKRTGMSVRGDLEFRVHNNRKLRVVDLSSGEQHLVALFTLLLFSAKPGSLVLIDEPEISLHAAWKHAFLRDIARVAKLARLQVILATHSTGIVNGQWGLVEQLRFPASPKLSADTVQEPELEPEQELDGDDER